MINLNFSVLSLLSKPTNLPLFFPNHLGSLVVSSVEPSVRNVPFVPYPGHTYWAPPASVRLPSIQRTSRGTLTIKSSQLWRAILYPSQAMMIRLWCFLQLGWRILIIEMIVLSRGLPSSDCERLSHQTSNRFPAKTSDAIIKARPRGAHYDMQEVQAIVRALDGRDSMMCERLDSRSLNILCSIFVYSQECLAQFRGFCLLTVSSAIT